MADRVRAAAKKQAPDEEVRVVNDNELIAELEKHILIDRDALDEMLIQHPDLFYRVSKVLVLRISQRDAAKQDLSEAEALADAQIRKDAAIAEEKITADQVKAEIKVNKSVMAAVDKLADLTYWVNRWSALKEAYLARSHALRDLVSLYGNNYWSDASMGRAKNQRGEAEPDRGRQALARARRGEDR